MRASSAADLRDALKPVIVKHHATITDPKQVGGMLRAFDEYQGMPTTRAALKLAPLVFLQPGGQRCPRGALPHEQQVWRSVNSF